MVQLYLESYASFLLSTPDIYIFGLKDNSAE